MQVNESSNSIEVAQAEIDIREPLFASIRSSMFQAHVVATACGVVAGTRHAVSLLTEVGCELQSVVEDGTLVQPSDVIMTFRGSPKHVAIAEDRVLGAMMVPSGYATRARRLKLLTNEQPRIVCGGWKKVPQAFKPGLHAALAAAGVGMRMVPQPFLYIDKNYVRMFGSVAQALVAAAQFPERSIVIQLRGELATIEDETRQAVKGGANVLMIDTGCLDDIATVDTVLKELGARNHVQVAFAGGVTEDMLLILRDLPVDIVDIGAAVLDAPMMDMRVDVVLESSNR